MLRFDARAALAQARWLDAPRLVRIAIVLAIAAVLLMAGDAWLHTRNGITDTEGLPLGRDFINYWSGAQLALHHQAAQVYDLNAFAAFERAHTSPAAPWKWYSYPPVALLLSLPLGLVGFVPGLILWLAASYGFCMLLLRRTLGTAWALAASFATPAALMNTLSGQNGAFSACLMAGGILLLASRPVLAGLVFGALCFKPHLLVLVPLALLAGRYHRALAATICSVLLLSGASWLLFGPEVWDGFLRNAPFNLTVLEQGDGFWPRMPTVFAATRMAGGSAPLAFALHGVSAAAALLVLLMIWRRPVSMAMKGASLIFATFLVTPYAWDYDLVGVTFAVAWLTQEGLNDGFRPYEKSALALAVALPFVAMPMLALFKIQLGFALLWLALIVTWRRARAGAPAPALLAHASHAA